ncbi:uncharacterized protein PHACADRAFT_260149 [Phanerochaete carnosa HHB-10118-sp]|uniref:Uncharacterized protein n=1 Tax=Phanerochaete carnosa (strain HHB-10118-sp) TaxID=650164 RepID=K5VQB9_PHACS|nr:uncharacterized protein PHACADRAFT_260149 [Phanerochaete carnosa HHB-10118-sp]EKM53673.1 hypothetical protein PHACADRAFT_260149 [Phanerochaete carnosa HHB-10118-sp]
MYGAMEVVQKKAMKRGDEWYVTRVPNFVFLATDSAAIHCPSEHTVNGARNARPLSVMDGRSLRLAPPAAEDKSTLLPFVAV